MLIFCFFSSCTPSKQDSQLDISTDERQWMEKFFHDLLFLEGGVYTLWGSKPVSEIVLNHMTDEEWDAVYQEEVTDCYINDNYDIDENWEKWEKIASKFPIKKYLLFRARFDEEEKTSIIYFVDIIKAATALQDHYELFCREFGFDFHPLEAILEMPDQESAFWRGMKHAEHKALLWGLLFGYGKTNAYTYNWKYFDSPKSCRKFVDALSMKGSAPSPKGRVRLSKDHFEVVPFMTFDENDERVAQYQAERERIRKIYKGKKVLDITLKKLISQ